MPPPLLRLVRLGSSVQGRGRSASAPARMRRHGQDVVPRSVLRSMNWSRAARWCRPMNPRATHPGLCAGRGESIGDQYSSQPVRCHWHLDGAVCVWVGDLPLSLLVHGQNILQSPPYCEFL
jgi:hypothetical protein